MITISVMEAGEYFRGLLLLIGKDHKITDAETVLMKRIGKALGFDEEFCDNAIQEILDNEFIPGEPPAFLNQELAIKFIRDGLTLAGADNELHTSEDSWLRTVAARNGLTAEWYVQERDLPIRRHGDPAGRLEVDDLSVEYAKAPQPPHNTA